MPCGGIYPLTQHFAGPMADADSECFQCGQHVPAVTHFCDEWDCYLHGDCIDAFLASDEGQIVTLHGHEVIR
jgi:hypothetical protein